MRPTSSGRRSASSRSATSSGSARAISRPAGERRHAAGARGSTADRHRVARWPRSGPYAELSDLVGLRATNPAAATATPARTAHGLRRAPPGAAGHGSGRAARSTACVAGDAVPACELAGGEVDRLRVQSSSRPAPGRGRCSLPLGVDVPVAAQREAILLVEARLAPSATELPVFSDLADLQYVRPERSGQLLVGNSDHSGPEWADPDDYSNRASDEFLEVALPKVRHRFPGLGDARSRAHLCGLLRRDPRLQPGACPRRRSTGLFVAAGFSGHGFKISPAVGELMADLVVHGDEPRSAGAGGGLRARPLRRRAFARERAHVRRCRADALSDRRGRRSSGARVEPWKGDRRPGAGLPAGGGSLRRRHGRAGRASPRPCSRRSRTLRRRAA